MCLCKCYETSREAVWLSTQATIILQEGDKAYGNIKPGDAGYRRTS